MAKGPTIWPAPRRLEEMLESFRRLTLMLREKEMRSPAIPASTGWAVSTGVAEERTITVSTVTATGIAQLLGTLVQDLKDAGILA